MAASRSELDYYRRVVESLKAEREKINSVAYNYNAWEVQTHDRTEIYEFLDKYLCHGIDLVTVQLSENCSDISTFSEDFISLLLHIQEKTEAEIIIIDDFWDAERLEMKKEVCEEPGVDFVDLPDIQDDDYYQAGMGMSIVEEDRKKH